MVIDTSALIAILLDEPEAKALVGAILADTERWLGAPSWAEASAVMLGRKGMQGEVALDALLRRLDVEVRPMSEAAAASARSAYARFGKGVGSPAVLNYGDCLSYGMAMTDGQPLLFTGQDFLQTDVLAVPY